MTETKALSERRSPPAIRLKDPTATTKRRERQMDDDYGNHSKWKEDQQQALQRRGTGGNPREGCLRIPPYSQQD